MVKDLQRLHRNWGHILPDALCNDLQNAMDSCAAQYCEACVHVRPDITATPDEWAPGGPAHTTHFKDGRFDGTTTGWHAHLDHWQVAPPGTYIPPKPSLFEESLAAAGLGTGEQRANQAWVLEASRSIHRGNQGAVGRAPHLDKAVWTEAQMSCPPAARTSMGVAGGAAQHATRAAAIGHAAHGHGRLQLRAGGR